MNRFICCIGFFLSVSVTFAQKVYFIYFETESHQPFFARINEKTYTSSAAGFLILSNLKDSSYTIKIGFPQNKWPEHQFSIPIRSKDRGFLLKNFGEKGWGLFDLQTLSIQMSEATNDKAGSIKRGGVSAFTEILSKASNDPSLLEESPPAIAKNEKKPVVVQQAPKKEDANTQKEQPAANTIAVTQTKKEASPAEVAKSPEDKKIAPLTVEQQKQSDTALAINANKTSSGSETTTQPAKNEVVTNQKEQPAANAIVVTQTKKEDPPVEMAKATESNKSAPISGEQQKKQDTALIKNANTTSTASVTAAQATKNENVATKKEQPAASAIVVTQTKKEDPPAEMAKTSEDKKTAPIISEQQKQSDTALVKNTNKSSNNSVTPAAKTETPEKYKTSVVTKKSESSTTDGFGLVFIDQFSNGNRDTIAIMIPNPKEDAISKNKAQPSQPKKFLDVGNDERGATSQVSPSTNKACPLVASDKDFFNLRKKMAAQRTDEQMVNESKRTFKSKCFTTEQIKNLGNLFLNEAGKFQFYEAAYPFSSDQGNFVALQSEFKDKYFIYRFKKLVNLN